MKTMNWTMKAAFLSAALLVCGTSALAATKVTVGVGHMCCDGCKTATKAALEKVASEVAIDGTNVTITLKEGESDIGPVLAALHDGGFPATSLETADPVTITVGHLCCGGCKASLAKVLGADKVDDLAAVKVGDDSVTVKAAGGKMLNVMSVVAVMEKGGFSAKKITIGATAAANSKTKRKVASR